jgi:hypothetical protein
LLGFSIGVFSSDMVLGFFQVFEPELQ